MTKKRKQSLKKSKNNIKILRLTLILNLGYVIIFISVRQGEILSRIYNKVARKTLDKLEFLRVI